MGHAIGFFLEIFFSPYSCVDIKTVNKGEKLKWGQRMYLHLLEVMEGFANRTFCAGCFDPMEREFIWDMLWDFWAWLDIEAYSE